LPLTEDIKVSELFIFIYGWTKLRHFTISFLMVSHSRSLLYNYNLVKISCLFLYPLHNYSTYWKSGNWISWKKIPLKVYAYTITMILIHFTSQVPTHLSDLHPIDLPLPSDVCQIVSGPNYDYYSSTMRFTISSPVVFLCSFFYYSLPYFYK
jgi:hypothetical protein